MPAMPVLVLGAIGAGTLMGAVSQLQAGFASEKANKYNAKVMEANAQAAERAANYKAQILQRQHRQLMGHQRAMYSKAGVDLGSGSPLDVLTEDAGLMAEDVFMTRYQGEVEATGFRNQARAYRQQGKNAKMGGIFGTIGTLVGGLGSMGSAYYAMGMGGSGAGAGGGLNPAGWGRFNNNFSYLPKGYK